MISRQEAKAQGLKRYFTGEPCLRGHLSERLVSTGNCCQCEMERKQTPEYRAQEAAYKQANSAKIAARTATYQQQNSEKIASYRQQNREKILARDAAYRQQNREKIGAYQAAYAKDNREKIAEYSAAYHAAYRQQNRHVHAAYTARYRAQKLQATPTWADLEAIKAIYEQAAFITRITGESNHVDHIIPLQGKTVCGLHVPANLQILTATENVKKSNKLLPTYETLESAVE